MLTRFSSACLSAWVGAHSSAHCADHPCGKASTFTASSAIVTTGLALGCPSWMKLLLSVNSSSSGFWRGMSIRSGLLESISSMTSLQLWLGVPASVGKKVVGFSIRRVLSCTCGFSQSSPWWWVLLELVSHLCPLLFIRAVTALGAFAFIFCPRVSLSASLTKSTVAANAWRRGGHPAATGSSRLDRYTTGHCHGPVVCVRSPVQCDFSHVQRGWSPTSHLAALMTERWSPVSLSPGRPFPVQVLTLGVPFQILLWL